ncbi:MAG: MerR family transcriptional regulator [Anaerolineae bacterium]|nr:MerR family transcriptional regulator [Anaerolineae bacterium]
MAERPELRQEDKAIYNIGAVTRMTGIPVATLRAWERRYSFPEAERTEGGHRLYSETEVIRLQWVKARIDEGMQTRHAVQALRDLEGQGRFLEEPLLITKEAMPRRAAHTSLSTLKERLEKALLARNTTEADQILGETLVLFPIEDLILDMMIPLMHDIGQAWTENRIGIAEEHLITQYLHQRLVMWLASGPPPFPVSPIVMTCAPNEWHDTSLLMLAVLIRRRRWPVTYLGQATPLEDLAALVKQVNPPAVVLVAMREETARALQDWPTWFPATARSGHPIFAFGGRIFAEDPRWQKRVSGIYLGNTLYEGVETLDRLLRERTTLANVPAIL